MENVDQHIPDEARERLLSWFRTNQRDLPWRGADRSPYTIWVSEVMLQQTRVDTVIPYYEQFIEAFPDVQDLANAREEDVLNLWEGLGFYARARNLHASANHIVQEYGGTLPQTQEELEQLPGIGPSTAAAILSFAYQKQVPYLDGNVFRVISRFTGYTESTEEADGKRFIRSIVTGSMPVERPGVFNEALIELGANVCTPSSPDCEGCPLASDCIAKREGIQEQLPYRGETRDVPTRTRTAVFIRSDDRVLLVRRPSEGLLGGMWEFPALWNEGDEPLEETVRRTTDWCLGRPIEAQRTDVTVKHKYSHFHLVMPVYGVTLDEPMTGDDVWQSDWFAADGITSVPVHRAAQKALEQLDF